MKYAPIDVLFIHIESTYFYYFVVGRNADRTQYELFQIEQMTHREEA